MNLISSDQFSKYACRGLAFWTNSAAQGVKCCPFNGIREYGPERSQCDQMESFVSAVHCKNLLVTSVFVPLLEDSGGLMWANITRGSFMDPD